MASFAQCIADKGDNSAGWETLRFFTYGAVMNNLIAAMCAMWSMWMYCDLPERSQQLALREENSWPARVARGESLSRELILDVTNATLYDFGMYKSHQWVTFGEKFWMILALSTTFLSLTTYVWITQSRAVAGALMMFAVPGFVGLWFPLLAGVREAREMGLSTSVLKKTHA